MESFRWEDELILYGMYDPQTAVYLAITIIDIAWGTFANSFLAVFVRFLSRWLITLTRKFKDYI